MSGQWKLPMSPGQADSRNFYFGSSSSTRWSNDLSHKLCVKNEIKIAEQHRKTPVQDKALPQTPWATQYDALMRPWSPFADVPEVPVVRPRTAMLLMRKMLLSNPAAGRAWEASHGQVDGKKVFKSLAKKSNHLHESMVSRDILERRCDSPLASAHQNRVPGTYRACYGDEDACIGEGTVCLVKNEQELASDLVTARRSAIRAKVWAAEQANSPLPPSFTSAASAARTSSDHSDEIIPSPLRSICSPLPVQRRVVASAPSSPIYRRPESYERLLLEKDMEEQRLSSLWSSRTDRPRSPFGRYDSKDTEARRKLVHNRQMLLPYSPLPHTSDAQATYHGMEMLVTNGQESS